MKSAMLLVFPYELEQRGMLPETLAEASQKDETKKGEEE
mgnify:CR=1 FL=1